MSSEAAERVPGVLAELAASLAQQPASSREDAIARARRHGLEVAGCGGRRVVAAVGDRYVAKFAWRPAGVSDNLIEARVFARADGPLRMLLCPVVELLDSGVLIMRRCGPADVSELAGGEQAARAAARSGITDAVGNLGWLDGRVVVYDYARVSASRLRVLLGHAAGPGELRL